MSITLNPRYHFVRDVVVDLAAFSKNEGLDDLQSKLEDLANFLDCEVNGEPTSVDTTERPESSFTDGPTSPNNTVA